MTAIAMVMHYFHPVLEHGLPPPPQPELDPQCLFNFSTHSPEADRNILPLPELSEWTLHMFGILM